MWAGFAGLGLFSALAVFGYDRRVIGEGRG
jgi:hypothetical protein